MTRTTHTPGPWMHEAGPIADLVFHGNGIATIATIHHGIGLSDDESGANARLIAAAPDLLDALALVRMSLGWQYLAPETREIIDAALAKARGEG